MLLGVTKYEELAALIDLVPRIVEEWSSSSTQWLYGTKVQCSHDSFGSLVYEHWFSCPPSSYSMDL